MKGVTSAHQIIQFDLNDACSKWLKYYSISFFIWEVPIFVSLFVSVKLNSAFIVDGSIRCLPAS